MTRLSVWSIGLKQAVWLVVWFATTCLLYFSVAKSWTWGTMDEPGLVRSVSQLRGPVSFRETLAVLFPATPLSTGMFKPAWYPYIRGRFVAWNSPRGQHVLQAALILLTLLAWALTASLFGVPQIGIALGLLMSLYFGPFTIGGMAMLSIQELPGTLLISWAVYFAKRTQLEQSSQYLAISIILAFLACMMKETFFCLIPSVALCLHSSLPTAKQKVGLSLLSLLFIVMPVFLWLFVRTSYSSGYSLNVFHLWDQTFASLKSLLWTYKFGVPLILIGVAFKLSRHDFNRFDAVCLSGTIAYFLILVPWTAQIGYYQGPIGPYLGFFVGASTASFLLSLPQNSTALKAMCGLVMLSCLLAGASIFKQARNTYRFNSGLLATKKYLIEHWARERVYVNGEEAAESIPVGMELLAKRHFERFTFITANTDFQRPAYIVIYSSERYPAGSIPSSAAKVLDQFGWCVYRYSSS